MLCGIYFRSELVFSFFFLFDRGKREIEFKHLKLGYQQKISRIGPPIAAFFQDATCCPLNPP